MRKPLPLPQDLAGRPFSTREATAVGVSIQRLRRTDLEHPFHGVRAVQPAVGAVERSKQYLPRMADDQFFSHTTAALIYGLPMPRDLEERVELDVSGGASRPQARGVIGHRCGQPRVRSIRGLVVSDAPQLFLELAGLLPLDELIIVGDALVRRKLPPTDVSALAQAVSSSSARGVRNARKALALIRPGTDSPMETRLRLAIVRGGLPEPVIGHVVRTAAGDYIGRPDLAYVAERIAIEYEGEHHRTDAAVFLDDITRRELMQEADWQVIRVIARDIFGPQHRLIDRIRFALARSRSSG